MSQKKSGERPENAHRSLSHRSSSRTVGINNTSLASLSTRLIPLCAPLAAGQASGCTCPSHNKEQPCGSPGKRPIEREWATIGHKPTWPSYSHNVGVRCGATLDVLDIDPRNGGTEYLAALEDITPKFAQQKSFWRTDPCAACRPMLIDFCPLVPLIALYFDS